MLLEPVTLTSQSSLGYLFFSLTTKLSADTSICLDGVFWLRISCVRDTHFSGATYLISLRFIIWAVRSSSEWPGSNGPSMSNPHSFCLINFILVSLSATGTFLTTVCSFTLTFSCRDAKTIVWLSKRSLLAPAMSAKVAPVRTWLVIQASNASSEIFWPGCPWAYAKVPKVCKFARFKLRLSSSENFKSMVRCMNWASESSKPAMAWVLADVWKKGQIMGAFHISFSSQISNSSHLTNLEIHSHEIDMPCQIERQRECLNQVRTNQNYCHAASGCPATHSDAWVSDTNLPHHVSRLPLFLLPWLWDNSILNSIRSAPCADVICWELTYLNVVLVDCPAARGYPGSFPIQHAWVWV